jgi:hypothetical protein
VRRQIKPAHAATPDESLQILSARAWLARHCR